LVKLLLGVYAHLIKFWEVDVMEAKPARQFPDAFNRIELRTIGRKKVEPKPSLDFLSPSLMQQRVMVLRVVQNNDRAFSASKILVVQLLQKLPTALGIEFFLFAGVKEFSIP
jgi:hypothetical protein